MAKQKKQKSTKKGEEVSVSKERIKRYAEISIQYFAECRNHYAVGDPSGETYVQGRIIENEPYFFKTISCGFCINEHKLLPYFSEHSWLFESYAIMQESLPNVNIGDIVEVLSSHQRRGCKLVDKLYNITTGKAYTAKYKI